MFFCIFVSCQENKVTDVKLNKPQLVLSMGDSTTLVATVLPKDAENKAVIWKSSNTTVATVDNNGTIIAKEMGITTITVITVEGNKTANCTITVIHPGETEMILVEGGTFMMGYTDYNDNDDDFFDDRAQPAHQVTLSSFKIGKYLVTQRQWKAVMDNNPSYFQADNMPFERNWDDLPVERVKWDDVQEFIKRLNDITGKNYRLPTEAEWEYAARGGKKSKGYRYSGSNDIDVVAWYLDDENYLRGTAPIGTKVPNELGIYDMSGNVWEWCNDWYSNYIDLPQINPQGPVAGTFRIIRGGSWSDFARHCHVWHRGVNNFRCFSIGFRLAHP